MGDGQVGTPILWGMMGKIACEESRLVFPGENLYIYLAVLESKGWYCRNMKTTFNKTLNEYGSSAAREWVLRSAV